MLYHLLHPAAPTLRVLCTHCRRPIRAGTIRWHCGSCHGRDVDLCEACFQGGAHREHRMTPYRVTFEARANPALPSPPPPAQQPQQQAQEAAAASL